MYPEMVLTLKNDHKQCLYPKGDFPVLAWLILCKNCIRLNNSFFIRIQVFACKAVRKGGLIFLLFKPLKNTAIMKILKFTFLGLALLMCIWGYSQPYAIPGAMGFAKNVRGAYAGSSNPAILYVDRLTDDMGNNGVDKGSLRWCLTQSGPRIILFEVSGYINLTSYIRVTQDYVSIYGQTAPSPGVTISGVNVVDFRCNYVVMQHLRFRSSYDNYGGEQIDALTFADGSNVFIDHCSFSYSEDECLGIGGSFGENLTVQNCIFSWPLHYNTGKGLLVFSNSADSVSILRNAFIHCADRNPFPNGAGYTAFETVNTISYNAAYFGQSYTSGNAPHINIIGNEWRSGPNSSGQRQVVRIRSGMDADASFYLLNNYSPSRVGTSEWDGVVYYEDSSKDSTDFKSSTPFSDYETNYYSYTALDDSLVANAGARPWDRDSVDILALNDMVNQTGSWITYHSQAYYPQLAQNTITLNAPSSPHSDSGDGYTNLEKWVYEMTRRTSNAADIVLLTDTANNGGDVVHYNWLVANGFDVTKLDIGSTVDMTSPSQEVIDQFNAADLVIVGRDANSNKYDGRGQDIIDSITAPVITVNAYGAQWGDPPMWFESASVSSISGSSIYIDVAVDTIFSYSNVVGDSILLGNSSFGVINASGTHNGTIIGSVDNDIAIIRFAKNVPYNNAVNAKTPLSDRTIFSFGNDSVSFTLTQDGQAAYYAEIRRLLGYSIEPPVSYFLNSNKLASADIISSNILIETQFPFGLYPNPAQDQLTISGLGIGARVFVCSVEGRVMEKTVAMDNTLNLNISNYKTGMYVVRVEMDNKSYSLKFIKQ